MKNHTFHKVKIEKIEKVGSSLLVCIAHPKRKKCVLLLKEYTPQDYECLYNATVPITLTVEIEE